MQPTPDFAAENALVTEHLPLVGYLVSEIIGRLPAHISRDDLTAAGLAALAFAARAYDPERGVKFSRFASTRIRGALIDELRSHDWASRSVRAKARQRDAAVEGLSSQLGRTPSTEEVAAYLGVGTSDVAAVEDDIQRAVVLSIQGFADPEALEEMAPVGDPGPVDQLLAREQLGYLHDAVTQLPERLRTVVVGYFFEERSMADIAAELGVSESRVSQMRGEALAVLKDGLNSQLDPELVETAERPNGCVARRREAYYAAVAGASDFRARLDTSSVETAGLGALTSRIA